MKENEGLIPVANLLGSLFQRKGWQTRLRMHTLFNFWDKVVGREIADHAQPHLIRGTVLWVKVSDQIWMQQLHFQKHFILEKVNKRLKESEITDIRFQLDTRVTGKEEERSMPRKPRQVDPRKLKKFESMISEIKDEEMKQALKAVWLSSETKGKISSF